MIDAAGDDFLERFDEVRLRYGAGQVSVHDAGILGEAADRLSALTAERDAMNAAIVDKGGSIHAPTQWAYDQACAALRKHREEAARLRDRLAKMQRSRDRYREAWESEKRRFTEARAAFTESPAHD